jgi:predicted NACHT family NTPase
LLEVLASPANLGLERAPAGYFERRLQGGRCVVLLDGLDEVLDQASHDRVVREIQRFNHEYPDNWLVVTYRVAGWRGRANNNCPAPWVRPRRGALLSQGLCRLPRSHSYFNP